MNARILLVPLLLSLTADAGAQGIAFTDLVVFGDSLSDNGNLFAATANPPAPYWSGRFSNGPVWVEQLANHLGLDAASISDHAVGGATTADVLQLQVLPYLASVATADPNALYVHWAGGNDLLGLIENPGGDPGAVIGAAMQDTANALLALVAGGANHVLVANLPDLSLTPFVVEFADPGLSAAVQQLTQGYNAALAQTLAGLEAATAVNFIEVDAFALTTGLVAAPYSGGFRVVDERALSPFGVVTPHSELYLFWDSVHPTTQGHSFIMGSALAELGILWGDLNQDGQLGSRDVAILRRSFGPCGPGTPADLDGDGEVDSHDLDLLGILLR